LVDAEIEEITKAKFAKPTKDEWDAAQMFSQRSGDSLGSKYREEPVSQSSPSHDEIYDQQEGCCCPRKPAGAPPSADNNV